MDLRSLAGLSRWTQALLMPAVLIAPALQAQGSEDDTYLGENPDRYASLRVLEGEATIRKGEVEEPFSLGVPITEGDVVESHGRGVLQLADGTRVAFGAETRFQVAALFQEKDPEHKVLLRLDRGRLRIALGRESDARMRVDTPSGSASLSDGSNAGFEVEPDRTVRVKVYSGRVLFRNERDQASILSGERLTVYGEQDRLDRVRDFSTYGGDAFDSWSDRALEVRRGPSWERVPPELRYYSDELDDSGEWVYVDEFRSWCWRPLRVSPEWRPYWRGRWGAYPGGMTWISDEPWGYVTYHYGRWGWSAGFGWYWIPGVYYAPAWVAWQTYDDYFGWAPMGYYGRPVSWGYGPWGGGYSWNIVEINFIHTPRIHTHTYDHPGIIRNFGNGPTGNRTLSPPWQQGPLVVSPSEFRHPSQIQQILREPRAAHERLRVYEQQSGRTFYRQPRTSVPSPQAPSTAPPIIRYGTIQPPPAPRVLPRPLSPPPASASPQPKAPPPRTPVPVPVVPPLIRHQTVQPPPAVSAPPRPVPPPPVIPQPIRKTSPGPVGQPQVTPKGPAPEPPPPPPPLVIKKKRPLGQP